MEVIFVRWPSEMYGPHNLTVNDLQRELFRWPGMGCVRRNERIE